MISAQCEMQNFEVTPTSLTLSWTCDDVDAPTHQYRIKYQLISRDQCDAGDGSKQQPFHIHYSEWRKVGGKPLYTHLVYKLSPYSTYTFTLQFRDGDRTLGDIQSVNATTGEEDECD